MGGIFGGPSTPSVDYAAQAAAREAEQAAQLKADREKKLAAANEARDVEAARLKRVRGAGTVTIGTGELAQTEAAALGSKLG